MAVLFTALVFISIGLFLYFKIKAWRTPESLLKRIHESKASIASGVFLTAFGINLLVGLRGTVDLIVGLVFVGFGGFILYHGIRAYQHYVPQLKNQ
ncbi:YtpI family protein [Halalkalibacterium halodurans]|uniref:BH3174 protein n=2 Tax=Halalkalibacterium halodurans TaxID=86665 RepID=Q9K833_HALH5|nr:YtpI family protein [Halalkalibacterium halodurans]MDY7223707.1 YtpI family protein [Halalkalibacterium halodurans]MDY7242928.1 YtpI family protein [Halalkalibacterium halodurans]MED3648020.1 YtpI family protein [Halalkalibacterium halodurans]MED4082156.1 YtpI family protein [Halalkalibacterium halodurans]MED4084266.1 YtpI family protein [Halalkalibacterium halodurans]